MPRRIPASAIPFSKPVMSGIVVALLGAIGLLGIMQWTAHTVRGHLRMASISIFPAALDVQQAVTAFEKMTRENKDAVVIQESALLGDADREAYVALSSLDSASTSLGSRYVRHQQITSLRNRIVRLRMRSTIVYGEAVRTNVAFPNQQVLAELTAETKEVQTALETLQSDLASDFKGELALIDELQRIQAILEAVVIVGVIVALFFILRSVIRATVHKRESDILYQAHLAREQERSVLRSLIDNIPDFVYVKDTGSRFVVANLHVAEVAGVKAPEDLVGKTDFEIFPQEMASAFYEDEQNVFRSGQPIYNREERGTDAAGNEIDLLTTKVPIRDRNGQITGIAGIGRDITTRKKMETALLEAERNYREIFDKAIVGIFQSSPEGRFLSVNPSMAFALGYDSPEEMIASITDILKQFFVSHKRGVEFMLTMDRVGGVKSFECEVLKKDGSKIWLTMSIRAIRQGGNVVRYEGMCEDITDRNALREQLLQAQKLESVGQLAAGIAHEINTPTQYIGDNVRFLQDAFGDLKSLLTHYERLLAAAQSRSLSKETIEDVATAVGQVDVEYLAEEIPKAFEQALEGITRVSSLVNAMKEFSHPDTKEKVMADLNHAIGNTIMVAKNEWKYVAEMETDFDPSLPLVSCQPGEINQVILNLIVNAAHAIADVMHKGGPAMGKIKVQTKRCPEWAEIRIQDSGTGIPEAVRSRIFDPFFTTKEVGKGTGQGLAISRSVVVNKHGGTIHFETEEGRGTTFIIRLPYDGKALTGKGVTA